MERVVGRWVDGKRGESERVRGRRTEAGISAPARGQPHACCAVAVAADLVMEL